ncbi:hypothetical protein DPMN_091127 [Dreissena polymorpha]|uniref:Uncharacterized protein n=1 Tax=Dreissena polymorpha TaxID=45954 RepID=A0A9D4QZQ7_DREPO|nr:hypothetical protein DPMN_091127 [Dreissena polymorpha]
MDETGISPEHRPPNVIAPTKEKPQAITLPRSTTTTLIARANAAWNHIPPFFVFKGKMMNEELMNGIGAMATMSETGCSNRDVFKEYMDTHFRYEPIGVVDI